MTKYSYEFKKKIIKAYENKEGGYDYLTKKYGIESTSTIRKWHNAYKEFGNEGLKRASKNKKYTFEIKISVVQSYLTSDITYQELGFQIGMRNPSIITKWVNDYRIAGPDALREKSKGRKPIMPKPKKIENTDENAKYLKQLEEENLKLRIENAYLKELRRLRLEEEALNKRRELSVASEENLD